MSYATQHARVGVCNLVNRHASGRSKKTLNLMKFNSQINFMRNFLTMLHKRFSPSEELCALVAPAWSQIRSPPKVIQICFLFLKCQQRLCRRLSLN